MKLRDFAILADENIRAEVAAYLRSCGHDVLAVRESSLIGASDVTLIRTAMAERRAVYTHDSDFGALAVAAREPILGIVYLRPGHLDPEFTIETLRILFDQDPDVRPPFIIVAARSGPNVRIRVRLL